MKYKSDHPNLPFLLIRLSVLRLHCILFSVSTERNCSILSFVPSLYLKIKFRSRNFWRNGSLGWDDISLKWTFLGRGHQTSNIHVWMFGEVRYFFNVWMFDIRMFANTQMFGGSLIFECSFVRLKYSDVRILICSVKSKCSDVQCSNALEFLHKSVFASSPNMNEHWTKTINVR